MRRIAAVPLLVLLLAACSDDPVAPASPDPSADPAPQLDETRLGVYEAMTRELVGAEPFDWKRLVIVSRLCENAGNAVEPSGCDDVLTLAEQEELRGRLDDLGMPVRFVEDPTPLYDEDWLSGVPQILVVRLGTIEERGDGVRVGGSYGCGGLCGGGTTYLLEERASGWRVVGTTGVSWIA